MVNNDPLTTSVSSCSVPIDGPYTESRIGGRTENQDFYGNVDTEMGSIFVVCDGMGGGPGGRTASEAVVNTVLSYIQNADDTVLEVDALTQAIALANETLQQMMVETPELQGMGSTIVALLITPDKAYVAHVGDSRLYQLRKGNMIFRTKDHSFVGEMVQHGTITEEQARLSAQSNIITRVLGAGQHHEPDIDELQYSAGDRFVLCTDGIWGVMPEEELINRFGFKSSLQQIAISIADEADEIGRNGSGHYDNLTISIIGIQADSVGVPKKKGFVGTIKSLFKKR